MHSPAPVITSNEESLITRTEQVSAEVSKVVGLWFKEENASKKAT